MPELLNRSIGELVDNIIFEVSKRGVIFDNHSIFPDIYFDELVRVKAHTLPLSEQFGGKSFGLEEITKVVFQLAIACPSTALCAAMHYYTLGVIQDIISPEFKNELFSDMWENGHFTTSFNQPNSSVVQLNQDYHTSTNINIIRKDDGYLVNGIKLTASGVTRFKYLPIFGFQDGVKKSRFGITALMLKNDDSGVSVSESWKLSGMRSTLSHNVLLRDVYVPSNRIIGREGFGIEDTLKSIYWSRATISSVYLGIASRAINHVTEILKKKKDKYSGRSLSFMPGVQFTFADMLIEYETAYNQLSTFVKQVDAGNLTSDQLLQKASITKYYVTKVANNIVYKAMELEGSSSLSMGNLLEKLYRDVRAASFHQPSEDLVKELISKKALGIIPSKSRWL